MSFFKFFGKKKSKDDVLPGIKDPEMEQEQERRRLKHSLSISRSGRFKQKKKERSGVLDRPELFDTSNHDQSPDHSPDMSRHQQGVPGATGQAATSGYGRTSSNPQSGQGSHSRQGPTTGHGKSANSQSGQGRSPNNSCREIDGRIIPGGIRMGQQGVAS